MLHTSNAIFFSTCVLYCLNITESGFYAVMMLQDFMSQYHTNKLRSH